MELEELCLKVPGWMEGRERFLQEAELGNRYYHNRDRILETGAASMGNGYYRRMGKNPMRSADNRIPANWHRILVDQKVGYLFSYPPQFDLGDRELCSQVTRVLGSRFGKVLKALAVEASNAGKGWLHYWYQPGGEFHYCMVDACQAVPVYDDSMAEPEMQYFMRVYQTAGPEGREITRAEVWDKVQAVYLIQMENGEFVPEVLADGSENVRRHGYGRIPFIAFDNNGFGRGDLPMYKELIDAIDKLISGFANDIDDIQEIIWVIRNYAGEEERVCYDPMTGEEVREELDLKQRLKAKKYAVVEENGGIDVLRNDVPYEARSRFLEILMRQLFISAMAVNPFPEHTGNQSGVYISFLYSLLELKCGLMETEFREGLEQLVEAVLLYLGVREPVEIEQIWMRNKPRNELEISQILAETSDLVLSWESKTKNHPFTEQWQKERERVLSEQRQKQEGEAGQ